MKKLAIFLSLMLFTLLSTQAQNKHFEEVKLCLASGNEKDLSAFFDNVIEISVDQKREAYTKSQAESFLKEFFKDDTPVGFDFIHKGESKGGLIYSIGNYKTSTQTYRVLIRMKEDKGAVKIYNLKFTTES